MATTTFTTAGVNNLWSNAANWSAGVPVNGDTAVIPVGQTCEFNADLSGFASGVTVQNNGTLHASTTAGSYVLKLAANMTGSGTLRAGTSGTAYPDACTFQISRGTNEITATSMVLDLNCSEPTVKWVKLTSTAAIGATTLNVDTDLTPYVNHWKANNLIRICDVNNGNDNEERTISSVTSTTIVITAGLTAQKEIGAYVALISRNVKIIGTSTSGNAINGAVSGRVFAEVRVASSALNAIKSCTVGGAVSGNSNGFPSASGYGNTISSVVCGNTTGASDQISNLLIGALFAGNSTGLSSCSGWVIDSTSIITGNGSGLLLPNSITLNGCVIGGNTTGIDRGSVIANNITLNNTTDANALIESSFYNCAFNGSTEFANYAGAQRSIVAYAESINHDGQAGAFKAWTKGGIVTKVSTPYPTGYDYSYDHACESASFYCFQNFAVTVPAGGGLVVQCEMRKDASMSYLPRVWILLPGVEPFISGSPSYEAIMTNSVNTWETLVLVYANATTAPVTVTVRTVASNATGHVYTYPINTVLAPATYDVYSTLLDDLTNIQSRLPATLVGGRMDSYVGAMATDSITAAALSAGAVAEIQAGLSTLTLSDIMDYLIETGLTFDDAIKLIASSVAGTLSGAGTNTVAIKNAVANNKTRITASVDSSGNRTAISYDLS